MFTFLKCCSHWSHLVPFSLFLNFSCKTTRENHSSNLKYWNHHKSTIDYVSNVSPGKVPPQLDCWQLLEHFPRWGFQNIRWSFDQEELQRLDLDRRPEWCWSYHHWQHSRTRGQSQSPDSCWLHNTGGWSWSCPRELSHCWLLLVVNININVNDLYKNMSV